MGSHLLSGWVEVQWDRGNKNSYRYGKESAFDVKVRNISLYLKLIIWNFYIICSRFFPHNEHVEGEDYAL